MSKNKCSVSFRFKCIAYSQKECTHFNRRIFNSEKCRHHMCGNCFSNSANQEATDTLIAMLVEQYGGENETATT